LCSCCSDPFKNACSTQKHSEAADTVDSWNSVPADHPNEKSMCSYLNCCTLVTSVIYNWIF